MPDPIETSGSTGGAANFFTGAEGWLNHPDLTTRQARRGQALQRVADATTFAGITTTSSLTTGMLSGGLQHFNRHWRAGSSGWWPRITPGRVNSEMSKAFRSALAPEKVSSNIRLKWDCTYRDLNALEYFWATPVERGSEFWIEIVSPRAPGGIDPESQRPNYGFNPTSDMEEGSVGPFTVLGDQQVANYDGTEGRDTSFDNGLGDMVTTEDFRESWSFFPIDGPVENGTQRLTGLSYTRDSWRRVPDQDEPTFEDEPLHSEIGYLLWDDTNGLAYRVIALPRGVTLLAVAREVNRDSTEVTFVADPDDPSLGGILSNPVLSQSVQTVRFESTMRIFDSGGSFTCDDRVVQRRSGQEYEHTDSNSLIRI